MRAVSSLPVIAAFLLPVSAVSALDTYLVEVEPKASSFASNLTIASPLVGTLIGNYDAKTNPDGTRTLPGLFGGTGNNPIPYTSTLSFVADIDASPIGDMLVTVDDEGLGVSVRDLSMDLLGGDQGSIDVTFAINYATFRTVSPSSLFPGGVTIPVPLGTGTVTSMTAVQNGNAVGFLVPNGKNSYQFTVAVPVDIAFVAELNGEEIVNTVTPGVLPLAGTLTVAGGGIALAVSGSDSGETTEPVEFPPIENQPLDLPTVIPTGSTANLLLNGTISQVTVGQSLDLTLVATGVPACPSADLNGDCRVDGLDLAILLGSWGARGPADINGDGIVDSVDLAILLAEWGA